MAATIDKMDFSICWNVILSSSKIEPVIFLRGLSVSNINFFYLFYSFSKQNAVSQIENHINTIQNSLARVIMNFYSHVSNTRYHSIGHKMRIARSKSG